MLFVFLTQYQVNGKVLLGFFIISIFFSQFFGSFERSNFSQKTKMTVMQVKSFSLSPIVLISFSLFFNETLNTTD